MMAQNWSAPSWEIGLALNAIGITDPTQRQTVMNALPVAQALVKHVNDNMPLFNTLYADIQQIMPALKIILDAVNNRGQS